MLMNPDKLHILADSKRKHRLAGTYVGVVGITSVPENSGISIGMIEVANVHLMDDNNKVQGKFLARKLYAPKRWETRNLQPDQTIQFSAKILEEGSDTSIPLPYRFRLTAPTKIRNLSKLPNDPDIDSREIVDASPDEIYRMMKNANILATEISDHIRESLRDYFSQQNQGIADAASEKHFNEETIPSGKRSKILTGLNLRFKNRWTQGEFWTRKIRRMIRRR